MALHKFCRRTFHQAAAATAGRAYCSSSAWSVVSARSSTPLQHLNTSIETFEMRVDFRRVAAGWVDFSAPCSGVYHLELLARGSFPLSRPHTARLANSSSYSAVEVLSPH